MADREFDGLVIADLEMQAGMGLDGAPVASIEAIPSDQVECARYIAPAALCEHEQAAVSHCLLQQREEWSVEIRPAPFTRTSVHVEGEERVPVGLRNVAASPPFDRYSGGQRLHPLLAHSLALPRDQLRQEIIERPIVPVLPVKLLVSALQEAEMRKARPLAFGKERDVQRRRLQPF